MFWKLSMTYGLAAVALVALVLGTIAWRFVYFWGPFAWTGEPVRLARVLRIEPGMHVADIGAGDGALAVAMASRVGTGGQVYATELAPERRAAIEARARRASARNVRTITATQTETGLPEGCCDAIYLRAVFHHIPDRATFAAHVARALRPAGRVAVIDFAPGALWFHGADHGVAPDVVLQSFQMAGLRVRERVDHWGSGMFLLAFEREGRGNP